ncbi:MAG: 5-formyltetrahydrofolate cyclo-ligase [Planctomycetia bacterium]|nr:5-formyltetrahydrofolate cyclo-ligase [Planctomycetia bacterium]
MKMTTDIRSKKKLLRKRIRDALGRVHPNDMGQWSLQIAAYAFALKEFRQSRVVMAYITMSGEVDTWPIIRGAWDEGKTVVLPRVETVGEKTGDTAGRRMVVVELEPCDTDSPDGHPGLSPSTLGILEPVEGRAFEPRDVDLVLAPGLAFDRRGWRLGKGGGFYDRLLSAEGFAAHVYALAFSLQIVETVPHGFSDKRVEGVITEAGALLSEEG